MLDAFRCDYGRDVNMDICEFEHTGIMHTQANDFSVYTHQHQNVAEILETSLTKINATDTQSPLEGDLLTFFWSRLAVLSWLPQTRADIAPFILLSAASRTCSLHGTCEIDDQSPTTCETNQMWSSSHKAHTTFENGHCSRFREQGRCQLDRL